MAHPLEQELVVFHPAASGGTEPQRSRTLRVAERLVLSSSTAPDPADTVATADYVSRRDDATLWVARDFWERLGGTVQSDSLSGVSHTSYADGKEVQRIIREQMGDFYTGSKTIRIL